ncbi:membrane protein [gut metagenome]|uniref:Membrane protein n=1 Tax=gut metagenome TaxID=749906 RepID=J9CV42_9ZZZZ
MIRFITPWIEDWRKLSEFDFIVKRYTNDTSLLFSSQIISLVVIIVISSHVQHLVGNEILTSLVGFHDGRHHVLRHILVVGQQLLGIFRQAITTVAKTRVIIVRTDTRIQAYPLNDGLRIQSFNFGIGIQLIEIADTECQIGIGKSFTASASFIPMYKTGISSLIAPSCNKPTNVLAASSNIAILAIFLMALFSSSKRSSSIIFGRPAMMRLG